MMRFPDTIAWRFGLTIAGGLVVTCALIGLFYAFGGIWARPPMDAAAQFDGATAVVQIIDVAPPALRGKLAARVNTRTYQTAWYAADSAVAAWLNRNGHLAASSHSADLRRYGAQLHHTVVAVTPDDALYNTAAFPLRSNRYPGAYYFAVKFQDASWLVFMGYGRYWGLSQSQRLGVWLVFLLLAVAGVAAITTRQISRPIKQFARAVRIAGANPNAPPLQQSGPQELREVIAAFNEMRAKIREFVTYRTDMLAAISHDLRTPLTRMRLRGEYIADRTQRDRLFRDIDEMQAMIDGALTFFRGDGDTEMVRSFDLPDVLQSIADDFADQGIDIPYAGPERFVYAGRPIALKRAFTNLIENAVKYATPPAIELSVTEDTVHIAIRDNGPGIAESELEKVFQPFYRLDKSRNRCSGGVGLGLTATLAVIRGHGGTLTIRNHPDGGLEALVTLPRVMAEPVHP